MTLNALPVSALTVCAWLSSLCTITFCPAAMCPEILNAKFLIVIVGALTVLELLGAGAGLVVDPVAAAEEATLDGAVLVCVEPELQAVSTPARSSAEATIDDRFIFFFFRSELARDGQALASSVDVV
jgi:hypothetical protein